MTPYRIKLDVFEGPFDLLLFLIRKNEVDIYDIPISKITSQFLDYITVMKILDLDVAGDFIEMVAILMNIKARMLLPREGQGEDDEDYDPRLELVERLLEYKQFKEAGLDLEELEYERSLHHTRQYFDYLPSETESSDGDFLEKITLFDLIMAFREAMENMPKVFYHEVNRIEVTVEEQSDFIVNKLTSEKMILFRELMQSLNSKILIIVTFIALLELAKKGIISVHQSASFDEIRLKLKNTD